MVTATDVYFKLYSSIMSVKLKGVSPEVNKILLLIYYFEYAMYY
jgi:hypothetical protein